MELDHTKILTTAKSHPGKQPSPILATGRKASGRACIL